ncbi:MAG: DUF58 domain-containing protein [Anaerolineae bacterium]|nr:DUF58 domain-containing protein [Anaerolineae bacterium]
MALLTTSFLAQLDCLSLVARRVRVGQTAGERRSTKRGTSVEFADYRDYARGDDLRRVDWNIYARLERPFIKLFEEEEDLAVHVLLDGSGSMAWGGESAHERISELDKWGYARRLAAALGYVALISGDRLTVANLQAPIPGSRSEIGAWRFGSVRGRGHALRLFDWLEGQDAQGTTDLNAALRTYAISGGRAGLVVLISDLFSPAGYVEGLMALAARGHEVAILHVLSLDEVEPPLGGDLRLLDVETGEPQEVTIDGGMRALYRRRLEEWRGEIRATCRARDVHCVSVVTDTPFDRVVLYDLRRVGVVR